jgi:uncharacterized protein (DUF1778 family)
MTGVTTIKWWCCGMIATQQQHRIIHRTHMITHRILNTTRAALQKAAQITHRSPSTMFDHLCTVMQRTAQLLQDAKQRKTLDALDWSDMYQSVTEPQPSDMSKVYKQNWCR